MSDQLRGLPPGLELVGDSAPFTAELRTEAVESAIDQIVLNLRSASAASPPALSLRWAEPLAGTVAVWTPLAGRDKGLPPDWRQATLPSCLTNGAPVACAVSGSGLNRGCVASSETLHPSRLAARVVEETADLAWVVEPLAASRPAARAFETIVRVDRRPIPHERALADAARWWDSMRDRPSAPVPDAARQPMYSTWYSFHQSLDAVNLERQCRIARELGCEAVIIDDGWQTLDAGRGYAFSGDWQPDRLPRLRELVNRLHENRMRVLLWYALPLVGVRCRAFRRFRRSLLRIDESLGAGILDPRRPAVRVHLIETLERAVEAWDLDGLKLDFLDRFSGAADRVTGGSVEEAVDQLLAEVTDRLRDRKPELLVEFREPYIGPRMRGFANMLRAADCPGDLVRNRISTVDLRLLAGSTACHSDMLMWHPSESPESAARQLLAVLFAVPQVSVLLDRLPESHVEMLRHWLGFWRAHRHPLLDGELTATAPELNYPVVTARHGAIQVSAAYADAVVPIDADGLDEIHLVNATRAGRLVIDAARPLGAWRLTTRDCRGRPVAERSLRLRRGTRALEVPPSGLATLSRS